MKKGFFFTMDALIAITLISFAFLATAIIKPSMPSENTGYERMHYITEDAMQIFGMTTFSEISSPVSDEIFENTNITEDYLNKSLLEVIGFLWADGSTEYVENISRDFFPGLIPTKYRYAISANNIGEEKNILYSSVGYPPPAGEAITLTKASRLISGYKKDAVIAGYSSRAWASKITKNASKVFEFNPEGGSYDPGGKVYITKKFFLNASEIYNATLHISIHRGTSALSSNSIIIDGGADLIGSVNWLYTQSKTEAGKATNMDFGVIDITTELNASPAGWHEIEIMLKSQDDFNTHLHPGTKIELIYKTNEERTLTGMYSERKYFDNIESYQAGTKKRGTWAIMPLNVPRSANVKNVTLHLRALDVYNDPAKDDIQIYFNNQSIFNVTDPAATYDTYLDLTDYVNSSKNSTNVLSVYIDSFENDFWGLTNVEFYSEPETDENASSYVYLEYDWSSEDMFRYGYIEVSTIKPLGGAIENPKTYYEDFGTNEITSAYLQIAQLDSESVTVTVEPQGGEKNTVFVSPRLRAMPSTLYIDPSYFNTSANNTINISDLCLTLNCPILPESSIEYNLFIPSQVGYGNVFNSSENAQDDAISRLLAALGDHASADQIEVDTPMSTSSIPWMYGPAIITFEVWK